jgi:hypothetical protein
LTEIHRVGVVHGDLTPRNVLLSPSGPRVIDFGIARVPEADLWLVRLPLQRPDLEGLDPTLREIVEAAMEKGPEARPSAATLKERLIAASRGADGDGQRAAMVDSMLSTAKKQSDLTLLVSTRRWPKEPGPHGVPLMVAGVAVAVVVALLTVAVWFRQPGPFGTVVNDITRWLFGMGPRSYLRSSPPGRSGRCGGVECRHSGWWQERSCGIRAWASCGVRSPAALRR